MILRFKKTFLITGLFLVLLPVIATAIIRFSDVESFLTDYVEKKTGREFSVSSLGMGWSLRPSIYVDNPRFSNASWGNEIDAFSAKRIQATFSILSLLRGEIELVNIDVISPLLIVENHPDTEISNFSFGSSSSQSNLTNIEVNRFSVVNGRIEVIKPSKTWGIEIDNLVLSADSAVQPIQGVVSGSIEGIPISLSGSLGSLSEILAERESAVELRGSLNESVNHLSVSGVIENLYKWVGLNLWIEAEVQDLSSLSGLLNGRLPKNLPITDVKAKWELVQPGKTNTLRIESLRANASILGVEVSMQGSVGALTRLGEIDLQFRANGTPSLEGLESIVDSHMLNAEISGSLKGSFRNLILDLNKSLLTVPGMKLSANGSVDNLLGEWSNSIPLTVVVEDLAAFQQIESDKWVDLMPFEMTGELVVRDKQLDLEKLTGGSDGAAIEFNVEGSFSNLTKSPMGSVVLTGVVNADNLTIELNDQVRSLLGNTNFRSRIGVNNEDVSVSEIDITMRTLGVSFLASGAIEDLKLLSGVNIELDGKLDGLQVLNSISDSTLPITDPIDFSATLENQQDGELQLSNVMFSSSNEEVDIKVIGGIRDVGPQQSINLSIVGEVFKADFGKLFLPKNAQFKLPTSLFPMSFQSTLIGNMVNGSFDDLSLQDILITTRANDSTGEVKGQLQNLHLKQVSGDFDISYSSEIRESAKELQSLLGQYPFVLKGKLVADLRLRILHGKVSIPELDMSLVNQDGFVKANGGINQFSPLVSDNLTITIEFDEIGHLISGNSFRIYPDISAVGTIVFRNHDANSSFDLSLNLADSDLVGKFQIAPISFSSDVSMIKGNVASTHLDFTKIFKEGPKTERVFSQDKLGLNWLESTAGEIEFDLDYVQTSEITLKDVSANAVLDPNKILISARAGSDQENGRLDLNLTMNRVGKGVEAFLSIDGEDSPMTMFNNANTDGNNDNGTFDAKIQIEGQGHSISEIMGASNGEVLFMFSGSKIKSKGLKLISDDFLHGILSFINPLIKRKEFIDVECAVARLNLENGLVTSSQGLAMKTKNFTILGGGEIDLKEEKMKLLISSKARKGLGINTNTVAKMINLGGTLKQPKVESNTGGFLQTGAAVGAAILSGGISLLAQGLYDKIKANSDVCGLALSSQVSGSTITIDK